MTVDILRETAFMIKEAAKGDVAGVFREIRRQLGAKARGALKHKDDLIAGGLGAAGAAGMGYVASKRWKGKDSIEQRAGKAAVRAHENRSKRLKNQGKEGGPIHDVAGVLSRSHKDMADVTAKYPARVGATTMAPYGVGAGIALKNLAKKFFTE